MIKEMFRKLFPKKCQHDYVDIYSQSVEGDFKWNESSDLSAFQTIIRERSFKGEVFIVHCHCMNCGSNVLYMSYPGGTIPYSQQYLYAKLLTFITEDHLIAKVKAAKIKRNRDHNRENTSI